MGQEASQPFFAAQHGLRVLHVWDKSPAASAGITPFIDFITGVADAENNKPSISQLQDFIDLLKQNENNSLQFTILNILTQQERTLTIALQKNWPNANNFLGILFRYELYTTACNHIMKVTNIEENSPAANAGLRNNEDFVLGFQMRNIQNQVEFARIVKEYARNKETFSLCIYNALENSIRYLQVHPNEEWGGKGCLGCELSLGLLNKVKIDSNQMENVKYYSEDSNFQQQVKSMNNHQQQQEEEAPKPTLSPQQLDFKTSFFSEKTQSIHEITSDQLFDTQLDITSFIQQS